MEGQRPETWRRGLSDALDGDALVVEPHPPASVGAFEEEVPEDE